MSRRPGGASTTVGTALSSSVATESDTVRPASSSVAITNSESTTGSPPSMWTSQRLSPVGHSRATSSLTRRTSWSEITGRSSTMPSKTNFIAATVPASMVPAAISMSRSVVATSRWYFTSSRSMPIASANIRIAR